MRAYPSRAYPSRDSSRGLSSYMLLDEMHGLGRQDMFVDVEPARRRFTRAEYHRMAEVGILRHDERLELICGDILQKLTQGRRHRAFIDNLNQILAVRLSGRAIVSVQMPIVLSDDTEPEPDVQLLRRRAGPYTEREADASDVLLLT